MGSTLLIGTAVTRPGAVGTLYRSENGGTWSPAGGMPVNIGVQALCVHPSRPGTVFAATRAGMFKSADGGVSWAKLNVSDRVEEFWSVMVHPADPDVLFAGTAPVGVYRSADGGKSWRRVASMPELCDYSNAKGVTSSRQMRIAFDPTDPKLGFGACETNGVMITEDGGESWRDISGALIELSEKREDLKSAIVTPNQSEGILDGHAVCVTRERPGTVIYACRMGLFSSSDKGKSWHNYEVGQFAPFSYCRDLRMAPDDPKTFYLALSIGSRSNAGALYRSTDICQTWKRVDQPVTAKSTIMSMNNHPVDPGKVLYITRGGQVMWTDDRCVSWNESQLPADAGDGFCAAIL